MAHVPEISKDTIHSLTVSMTHDRDWFKKYLKDLKKDNTLVYGLLKVALSTWENHESAILIFISNRREKIVNHWIEFSHFIDVTLDIMELSFWVIFNMQLYTN